MAADKIEWVITCYSKETEFLVKQHKLPKVDLPRVRKIFRLPEDDPVCYSYPIDEGNVDFFRPWAAIEYDFTRYEYYFESNAV